MSSLPFNYTIRRSARAQKARIVVKPDKIEVVLPPKAAESLAHQFVLRQKDWIIAAINKVAAKMPHKQPAPVADGLKQILYRGQWQAIRLEPSSRKRIQVTWQLEQGFVVYLPATVQPSDSMAIKAALFTWMFSQAHGEINGCIQKHAPKQALFPKSLTLRTQKSRWGSCSGDNRLNMNALLMLAPPEVLEYVVVHELCHIRHKNHSTAFWQLVADHLPDYARHRLWLKQHGGSVMRLYHG